MSRILSIDPIVGDWYSSHGHLFEVIAVDEEERVVEVQHADGDLEEIDIEDWVTRCRADSLRLAEPPDNSRAVEDHDLEDSHGGGDSAAVDELRGMRAEALDDLDLFE